MRGDHIKKEMEWFEAHRKELLEKARGKWVAVYNQKLIGIYDDLGTAYDNALDEAKSTKVLIKQILEEDEPLDISVNYRLGLLDVARST